MNNRSIEILLIDDNLNDAELMIRALKKNNFANYVTHLKDGVEGLQFIFCTGPFLRRDVTNQPKVIFLDLKMPRVDGMEVLEKIKANGLTKSIPVVVLTSSKQEGDIRRCYDLGVSSYVVKPVGYENFSNTVAQLGNYWLQLNEQPKYNI